MSNSECIIEELSNRCYNKGAQAKNHMKKLVLAVLKRLKREIDSVKAIGSMEVGVTCEEPNVLELDEHAEELQNVFDIISGVRLDPVLLRASRKVEIDFMNRLGRREQRGCQATRVPVEIERKRTQTLEHVEKKWQRVTIDSDFVIGTWSPAIVCCRECELCMMISLSRLIQCTWRG